MTPALNWASAEDENAALRDQQQRLEAAVDRLVAGGTRYPPNRRLLNHLANEHDHLFTFLRIPGVQATDSNPQGLHVRITRLAEAAGWGS
jgi:hypothetical protein